MRHDLLDNVTLIHLEERQSSVPNLHSQLEFSDTCALIKRNLIFPFQEMAIIA